MNKEKDKNEIFNKLLRLIEKYGALTCTGSCFRIGPNELHCKRAAIELGISVGTLWDLVERGVEEGIIVCEIDKDKGVRRYKVVHQT
ncbi:hypothetical protein DRN58_00665 [Thermococci archaeon]|nr:MAG: hypothetical protein DRN41_00265 [Thermococci archaeon]RLG01933.1 MAG: hypothetical protein DRN58_00665 [Thermococci archaeon]